MTNETNNAMDRQEVGFGVVEFVSTGPSIQVGPYLIRQLLDGSIWMENEIGEGMQVKASFLHANLDRFWNKHF